MRDRKLTARFIGLSWVEICGGPLIASELISQVSTLRRPRARIHARIGDFTVMLDESVPAGELRLDPPSSR